MPARPQQYAGIAHRAAEIVAVGERRDAHGERRGGAAAGATGRAVAVPRIEGASAEIVVGVPAQAEGRRVGAADDDRAGALPVGHRRAVGRGDDVLERDHAVGSGGALLVHVLLDRHQYAMQKPQRLTVATRGVGAIGRGQRLLGQHDGHRVELGVDGLQPGEDGLCRLATSDLCPCGWPRPVRPRPSAGVRYSSCFLLRTF
jgi:hypothetical protein